MKNGNTQKTQGSPPLEGLGEAYTDHLGNIRVSYTKDPGTGKLEILDESHYYPFGLKHQEYQASSFTTNPIQGVIIAPVVNNPFKYRYNGFEYQDELGLGWYDYLARNYDPAIGRWMNIDPLAEMSRKTSPYVYALNNPVFFIDPDGMLAESFGQDVSMESDWIPNGDGTYTAEAGDSAGTLARDAGIDFNRANELVQSQLGDNYTGADGGVQSNVEVGDVVTVPEQVPVELETVTIISLSSETITELNNEIGKLDSMIKVNEDIIDFNIMANEISEEAGLNKPVLGDPGTGIHFGEEANKARRRRIINKNKKKKNEASRKKDSIQNIFNNSNIKRFENVENH